MTVSGDELTDVIGIYSTGAGLKAEPLPASEPLRPPLITLKPGETPNAPDAKIRQGENESSVSSLTHCE